MSKQSRKTSNGDRVESVGISSEVTVKSLPPAALMNGILRASRTKDGWNAHVPKDLRKKIG